MALNTEAMSFKNQNLSNRYRDRIIEICPSFKCNYQAAHDKYLNTSNDFTKDQLWVILSSMAPANVPNRKPFVDSEYCSPEYTVGELGYLITGWQFNLDLDYIIISAQTEKDYAIKLNELTTESWNLKKYNTPPSHHMYTHYADIGPLIFATINPILRYLLTACRFHTATLQCPREKDNIPGFTIPSEEWRELKWNYIKEVCDNFNKLTEIYNTEKIYIYNASIESISYDVLRGNGIRIVVDYSICKNPTGKMSFEFLYPDSYPM